MLSMKYTKHLLPGVMILSLAACGGGGGSSTDDDDGLDNIGTGGVDPQPATQLLTGRFVDAEVDGMQYSTATQSGVTDADGSYNYLAGESVTFFLGDIVLPAADAGPVVTPLDVFSTDSIADPRVINLTRLLQSLDVDGDPDNGITLSDSAAANATGLSVDFGSADFDNQVVNLVANSGSVNTSLIEGEAALDHFQETLFREGIVERPEGPDTTDTGNTPAPEGTSTSPLIGTSAEFSNFSHDISGTLTIIDDRTLEVSNFGYDGGGPSVFFYLGTDGEYSGARGGILVGPQLNGRTYEGDTIRLTLPAGVTLDDFNGVSVWCDIFSVNFGDAMF